ncbi:MAG: hypothetical protein GEU71_07920 [Actinobacteria bacterium]|nr:hypothetical protein [Actinomycetota bacterium]
MSVDRTELEALSSKELHDLAIRRALEHVDVAFLWKLIREVPAAQAAAGNVDAAETDVMSLSSLLNDVMESDEGTLAEALRPVYLNYLTKHS